MEDVKRFTLWKLILTVKMSKSTSVSKLSSNTMVSSLSAGLLMSQEHCRFGG